MVQAWRHMAGLTWMPRALSNVATSALRRVLCCASGNSSADLVAHRLWRRQHMMVDASRMRSVSEASCSAHGCCGVCPAGTTSRVVLREWSKTGVRHIGVRPGPRCSSDRAFRCVVSAGPLGLAFVAALGGMPSARLCLRCLHCSMVALSWACAFAGAHVAKKPAILWSSSIDAAVVGRLWNLGGRCLPPGCLVCWPRGSASAWEVDGPGFGNAPQRCVGCGKPASPVKWHHPSLFPGESLGTGEGKHAQTTYHTLFDFAARGPLRPAPLSISQSVMQSGMLAPG